VPGVTSDHRQRIKIELLRADAAFWKSPETSDAHLATMRQAFEGVVMVLFVAGVLMESLLRNEIPQLVWDSAIAAGWWRCASETLQNIFPERVGHYWVWRDDRTDWHRLFHDETEEWVVRLPVISAKAAVAPNLGARLNAACDAVMISHQQQAARIGIGRSTYFEGESRARRQEGPATGGRIPPQSADDAKTGLNRDCFGTLAPGARLDHRAPAATGRETAEEQRRTTHHGRSAEMSTS
jgi:hypothetical protein